MFEICMAVVGFLCVFNNLILTFMKSVIYLCLPYKEENPIKAYLM